MRTTDRPTPRPISDDALEVGKAVVGLLGVRRATRGGATTAGHRVSSQGIRAAIHLYQHGEMTIGEMAKGLGISRGWASRVVEELERAEVVVCERQATDRRAVHVRLGPGSIPYVEGVYRVRAQAIDSSLAPFDPDERAVIIRFLQRLEDELRAATAAETDGLGPERSP